MKNYRSIIVAITIIVVAIIWFNSSSSRMAPDMTITSLSGNPINTAERQRKPLLITFWATSCVSCIKEIPHLIALQKDLNQQLDIAGVAMSYDPLPNIREMIRRRQINYPVVFDADGTISQAFGDIKLTPTTFLISPTGEIIFQKIGDIDFAKLRDDINSLINQKTG